MSISRVTAERASLVWIVESTKWPVRAARRQICGRLLVADLADHDHVGVLPEEGPEGRGEGQADLRLDLDLVHPLELVLDRVLDRADVRLRLVEQVQAGVERGALAAAGRAR